MISLLISLYLTSYVITIEPPKLPAIVTAYTARAAETDSTPHINASGRKPQQGDVANNCLPFGSLVKINEKQYVVRDRMNKRYGCTHYDILVDSVSEAIKFGRQRMWVTIL